MSLTVTTPEFQHGEVLPTRYTRDGWNVSPPLLWRGAPPETRSFVVIMEDPDAPSGPSGTGRCITSPRPRSGCRREPQWRGRAGRIKG